MTFCVAAKATWFTLILVVVCVTNGCIPTPYQREGPGGGFSEIKISDDSYRVIFAGNRSTAQRVIWNYLSYRCAELTIQQGYDSFVFVERLVVARDRSVAHFSWIHRDDLPQYRITPVGGGMDAGALLKFAIEATGIALSGMNSNSLGQDSKEETGGVAQAVIRHV